MRPNRRLPLLVALVLALFAPTIPASAAEPALPTSMAATGDSITRAYDAALFGCFLADCPQYSWSTGTSSTVNSQYTRIRAAQQGAPVTAVNVARTGARVADLDRQLASVAATTQYVTVQIGANDVCTSSIATMTPTATFESSFRTALTNFFQANAVGHVSVSSIPNVYQLWSLLKGNRTAVSTWRNFGICQSMLSATNTESQRQTVLAREKEFNAALASVCAAFERCRWDGGAVFGYAFTTRDVSTVDYFHPSVTGQASLARVSWGAGYWPTR